MAITKLKHHDKCPVSIHKCKPGAAHFAAMRCAKHNKLIQWLNQEDTLLIRKTMKIDYVEARK